TGCAQSFGGPAYQSLIPSLVDKKDLPNAVALNSIQFNVARVLGPLAFGLTLAAFRQWGYSEPQAMNACFLLNSLSFLVVINTLMMLRVKHIPPATSGRMGDELRSGLSYVRHHPSPPPPLLPPPPTPSPASPPAPLSAGPPRQPRSSGSRC